ncbi:hypothetical protein HYU20_03555 [Candidatus Woesearchaeota archaeon]|nr:hypothetical protein [Candidatus Woesearchaeota archaeon]
MLHDIALVYARKNEEIVKLCGEIFLRTKKEVDYQLLMRGVLGGNSATLALYPDERVIVPKAEDLSRKIIELVRQGIPEARRIGAEYFGVPEEECRIRVRRACARS